MTTWISTIRKAAKPHRCESCWRMIAKGEDYNRTACFDGGTTSTYIECTHCRAFADLARDDIDPNREGYDFYAIQDMECTSSQIAIWHTQWRQKWADGYQGKLVPIPAFEDTAVPA